MAKMTVRLPDELIKKIGKLVDNTDRIIASGLDAGGEVMEKQVRKNLEGVIGKGTKYPSRTTGELLRSLGHAPVLVDHNGIHNTKVGFHEPNRANRINAKIANVLEYGKGAKSANSGQVPKPFLAPAKKAGRKKCAAAIKETLSKEIDKIL